MNQEGEKSRKKVLFVITKATWGGAQRYVYDLATHLNAAKYEVHVAYGTTGKLSDDLKRSGIETHEISALGRDIALFSDIASFFQIIRCIRNVRPDVLHLNSSKAAALGALAGRLFSVPRIIFTVHGWPFKENRNSLVKKLICMASWFTAALSDTVIVVSTTDLEMGKMFGGGVARKMRYIPIGIDAPKFLSRDEALAKLSIATKNLRIVTIAELAANKGIRYAIEAVSLLKNRGASVSYFIIGDGEDREKLEELAREKRVSDRVRFLGFMPDAGKYLQAFDIFLLPSIKEGMPYVLLEAAAAGLPVVATNIVEAESSNIPNIRFVPPGNGQSLADEIERLVNNLPAKRPRVIGTFAEMLTQTTALY